VLVTSALAASAATHRATTVAAVSASRPDYLRPIGTLVADGVLPPPTLSGERGANGLPSGTRQPPAKARPASQSGESTGVAPYEGSAGTLTAAEIAILALEQGCPPDAAATATAIAMAESGGSPSAQGDISLMTSVWDWSAGLWQIRGLRAERNTGQLRDSVANEDAAKNASAMYAISLGCSVWTPWSTFNRGNYLAFLPLAEQAVRYVLGYYRSHGHRYPPVSAPGPITAVPVPAAVGAEPGAPAPRTAAGRSPSARPTHTAAPSRSAHPGPTTARPTATPPSTPAQGRHPKPVPTTPRPTPTLPVPLPTPSLPLPTPTLPRLPTPTLPLPTLTLPTLPHLP
jgi:hypothetical protein